MRLQLIALVLAVPAHADVTAGARVAVYHDSDATTVTTSTVGGAVDVAPHVRVDAQYLADAVSSASVDVVSAATPRIHDLRHEGTGGVAFVSDTTTIRAGYIRSGEHDWSSDTLTVSASHDLLVHNLTVSATLAIARNLILRDDFPDFREHLHTGGGELAAAYTLTPRDLVAITAGASYLDGYQASPYRFVVVDPGFAMFEHVPRTRLRTTLAAHWNHALLRTSALRTQLRAYRDSWQLLALTASAELITTQGPFDLGVHARVHAQRGTGFYREDYMAVARYMTADRELSSLHDELGGISVAYHLGDWTFDLAADAFHFDYLELAPLHARTGVLVGTGVRFSR